MKFIIFFLLILFAYLDALFVGRLVDISLEDVPDVLLTAQVVEPHGAQLIGGDFALQIEQIVVAEFAKRGRVVFTPAAIGEVVPVLGAVYVGARPGRPKDGAHLLVAAAVVVAQPPGQRPRRRAVPDAQPLAYFRRTRLPEQLKYFDMLYKS